MAGSTRTRETTTEITGPVDIWLNVGLPAEGAAVNIYTDGTPDATDSPSCVYLGKLKEGAKLTYKEGFEGQFSDESPSPYRFNRSSEEASISGSFLQALNAAILSQLRSGWTKTTPTNKNLFEFGGKNGSPTTFTALAIWPLPEDPTKFGAYMLYKAFEESGFEADIKRGQDSPIPFTLRGMEIVTRTAGKRLGQFVRDNP